MRISIIVAMDQNQLIGNNNQLPWHLPADLKHFKTTTMGKPIIMGRKTFESIGKALPGRDNIVLTRHTDFSHPDITVFHSLDTALATTRQAPEIMLIGGANLYQQALSVADRLYITKIHSQFSGDTYFPEINFDEWTLSQEEKHQADDKNKYAYSFLVFNKAGQ